MKTLVIANQKGGVGKTANLVHLAWAAAKKGKKVIVIDLDTQGNASDTLSRYIQSDQFRSSLLFQNNVALPVLPEDNNITVVMADLKLADLPRQNAKEAFENFQKNIDILGKSGFDLCLIDTPPSLGVVMAFALKVSDFIVSPIEMETYSAKGVGLLLQTIGNLGKMPNFLGLLPSKLDRRNPRQKREYEKLKGKQGVLDFPITLRTSIGDALAEKCPVWEIKKTSARQAAKEVQLLANNIFMKMGI
ncbi:ParA family protein [Acetobacteraceae bacterium]|nr:ParA family protein [Acetobacteraceae bacterium]